MAKQQNNLANTKGKEEIKVSNKKKKFVPQYYTAYPCYNDAKPKKIKGLVLDIDGTKYYINLIDPVVTEKKVGDRVIYSRKEFNVCTMPPEKK